MHQPGRPTVLTSLNIRCGPYGWSKDFFRSWQKGTPLRFLESLRSLDSSLTIWAAHNGPKREEDEVCLPACLILLRPSGASVSVYACSVRAGGESDHRLLVRPPCGLGDGIFWLLNASWMIMCMFVIDSESNRPFPLLYSEEEGFLCKLQSLIGSQTVLLWTCLESKKWRTYWYFSIVQMVAVLPRGKWLGGHLNGLSLRGTHPLFVA